MTPARQVQLNNRLNSIRQTRIAAPASMAISFEQGIKAVFWATAVFMGLVQAWASRHTINADGISYLDIGSAYFRGDWTTAINGMWSPLYPWLLGLTNRIIQPTPHLEYSVAHLVNFATFLATLCCFTFFLNSLIGYVKTQAEKRAEERVTNLPEWSLLVLGYTFFIWSSLYWIHIADIAPDLLVAAFVYLASGILLRVRMRQSKWVSFFLLGVVLGFGYLAKTAMFPLAFVFLAVSALSAGAIRRAVPRTVAALLGFTLIAGPFIFALSQAKNRLTFGDSGKLNYAWHLNGIPYKHWQGEPPGSGRPQHPTRRILENPAIYEFGDQMGATYPVWYDPSYWYEGVRVHFDLGRQIRMVAVNAKNYFSTLSDLRGSLFIGLPLLFYMTRRRGLIAKDISEYWFLILPAVAALVMYALVHVEERYLAPFLVLLLLGLFCGVRLPDSADSRRLIAGVTAIIWIMFIISVAPSTSLAAYSTASEFVKGREITPDEYSEVAVGLKAMGVQPGTRMASLESSNLANARWARLAGVQIIAEINSPDESDFWSAESTIKDQIIQTFARTGAAIIVARQIPVSGPAEGWQRIGNTSYYVYFLPKHGNVLAP